MTAMNVTDPERKKALLLHLAGDALYDVYDGLVVPAVPEHVDDPDVTNVYTVARKALDDHFSPTKNAEFEIYNFRLAKQRAGETIDAYHSRLRSLAKYCQFADTDAEIKSHIIQTCLSTRLRRRALSEPTLTFTQLMDIARAMETAERQVRVIEAGPSEPRDSTVAAIHNRNNDKQRQQRRVTNANHNTGRQCRNCGGGFPHPGGRTSCPAWGKQCRSCSKANHFARQCRSATEQQRNFRSTPRQPPPTTSTPRHSASRHRQIRHIHEGQDHVEFRDVDVDNSTADDEYAFTVDNTNNQKQPSALLKINGTRMRFLIDTGVSVNIIDESTYSKLTDRPALKKAHTKIYAYGSKAPLKVLGTFTGEVETTDKITDALFYVVEGQHHVSLLGFRTASLLGVIKVAQNVNIVQSQEPITVKKLATDHPELFNGIGKLKNHEVELHIDKTVKPVAQPHRRIPFHLRKKVEEELQDLLAHDIIEKVEGPTPWVSPIVTPPKPKQPDKVRICVDMRQANQAIIRERHLLPTLDDVIYDLNGSCKYSKLDLAKAYHQLSVQESSRFISTFSTHVGLFRYKRLNFGISCASEIFQNTIAQVLHGIPGVKNISDDIIVFGATPEAHDKSLRAVITRLLENGLTLNMHKCELNQKRLEFFWHIFTADGVSVDPKRIDTIQKMQPPRNAADVRSLLGMLNYNSRFIPDYASLTEPLRRLTRADTQWEWGVQEQQAFADLKNSLCKNIETAYFNPNRHSVIHTDAGPTAISGVLSQLDDNTGQLRPITYVSRALTDVERRFSQTEREALSCVWAVERLHQFIFGSDFDLVTDHKALETILGSCKARMPARIERWGLRLSPYRFRVIHRPGKSNPADYLSRHTGDTPSTDYDRSARVAEEYINMMTDCSVPKTMGLDEIREATRADPTLQQLQRMIHDSGWTESTASDDLRQYKHVFAELSTCNDIILRGTQIVIPKSLQQRVIELAHEGHQGIVKTKALLRSKVYFPGIDRLTEQTVKQCIACQANTPEKHMEPLQMTELPPGPWQNLSIDFCGPFQNGQYLLCLMDDFSRFCFAEPVHSTAAKAVIPVLDNILSSFGNIQELRSDNGPPFTSHEFAQFAKYYRFHHRRITPLWPRGNGEIERFMRTITKSLRAAVVEGKCFKQHLHSFLRAYRSTPQSTTQKSPAELLFGVPRSFRTRMPEPMDERQATPTSEEARRTDRRNKQNMKQYADKRNHASASRLNIGDKVIVLRPRTNKLTSLYDPEPYSVTKIKGSMITATRPDHTITRNSSHFKRVHVQTSSTEPDEDEDYTPPVPSTAPTSPPPIPNRYPQRHFRRLPQRFTDYCM